MTVPSGDVDVETLTALRAMPGLRRLSDADLATLGALATHETYARGALVLGPQDGQGEVLIIIRGGVRVYRLSKTGHEVTVAQWRSGGICGLTFLEPNGVPRSFFEASENGTQLLRVAPSAFRGFLSSRPALATDMLALASGRLEEARDQIEELALHDMKTRLARTLARLAAQDSGRLVLATHAELAALVGTRQEEVTKALRQFRERGLVEYRPHSRKIVIPDLDRLSAYSRGGR